MFLSLFFLLNHILIAAGASPEYTLPENYFINCGSSTTASFDDFQPDFIGDENPNSFSLSAPGSQSVEQTDPPADLPAVYHTARIFTGTSKYEFDISEEGIYILRLHFFPFANPLEDLNSTLFNVSIPGFTLLSNFTIRGVSKLPDVHEFLASLSPGKFKIFFRPAGGSSSTAFVNAIEAFRAPDKLVGQPADLVTPAGNSSNSLELSQYVSRVIHRINAGGGTFPDFLGRNWLPDDDYLVGPRTWRNYSIISTALTWSERFATRNDAPDQVYSTARGSERNNSSPDNPAVNISWSFTVGKNKNFTARFHFCDVISVAQTMFATFNLYIYSHVAGVWDSNQLLFRTPSYMDFVVASDDSGVVNISVGTRPDSKDSLAFLNGVEIKELIVSSPQPKDDDNQKNLAVIIGPVVGGVVLFFILVAVLIIVFWRRRKQKVVEEKEGPSVPPYVRTPHSGSTERTRNSSSLPDLNLGLKLAMADILYATKNFDEKLMVGKGGFGKVYKGVLPGGERVAVKRSEARHGQGLPEFHTEVTVLSRIQHRHLVRLIGYCDEGSEMILVYEFMEKGTLRDHLYRDVEESGTDNDNLVEQSEFSWQQRLEICIGAAKGLQYLHTGLDRPIIHRDIKSTNILLDENLVAKVSDFGLSRSGPLDQTHFITDVKGSFGYLDPDYLRCGQLTQKSDVYSFGVVLLEVLCARPAINSSLPRDQINLADWGLSRIKKGDLESVVDPLLAGRINPNSLRRFAETVDKCLQDFGDDRPNMVDVLWDLEYALRLQLPVITRQPFLNSTTTDVSVDLPSNVLQRLPSHSFPISDLDVSISTENSSSSYVNASQVFSQLGMNEAR